MHPAESAPQSFTARVFTAAAVSAFVLATAAVLPACNAVEGAGEDLEQASEETSEFIDNQTD